MGDAIHGGNREKDEIAAHHIDFELAISINIQPMKDRRVNTIRKVIYTVEQADIKSALILRNRIHRQQYEDHGNCPPGSLHHNANLHKKLGMTGMPEQKNAPCIKL